MPQNMSEKANMLIIPTYRCQLSPLDTQRRARGYPTIVNNIQPCPKLCILMPLARVGARTDSTTSYSYNARRGQLPRTRIGIVCRTRAKHAICAEGLHFSAFHYKRILFGHLTPAVMYICTMLPIFAISTKVVRFSTHYMIVKNI